MEMGRGHDPGEFESTLAFPTGMMPAVAELVEHQDGDRGTWGSPRDAEPPDPPWPAVTNPMLRMLLWKAQASLEAGMPLDDALVRLGTTAWFEGGVEGYDRGQRDARRPRISGGSTRPV